MSTEILPVGHKMDIQMIQNMLKKKKNYDWSESTKLNICHREFTVRAPPPQTDI